MTEEINIDKWHAEYKTLCMKLLGMSRNEAEAHFKTAKDFDYGYSPIWYVIEEMNCQYVKEKNKE